jgi:hypothetical protein
MAPDESELPLINGYDAQSDAGVESYALGKSTNSAIDAL